MIRGRITKAMAYGNNAAVHHYAKPADPRQIIEQLRRERGFRSVRALAIAADIQQPTLARYLKGASSTMDVDKWRALAQTLGVTVSELLGEVPLSSGGPVREVVRLMARMTPAQQARFLRVGQALSSDDQPDRP
jgi:transcriptional regulator with XRE-family HTH domain